MPALDDLEAGGDYRGVAVSTGEARDGESAERVVEYLRQHIDDEYRSGRSTGLPTLQEPPTLHLAAGTSDAFAAYVEHAVQLINTALPVEKRIRIEPRAGAAPDRARGGSRRPDLRRLHSVGRRLGAWRPLRVWLGGLRWKSGHGCRSRSGGRLRLRRAAMGVRRHAGGADMVRPRSPRDQSEHGVGQELGDARVGNGAVGVASRRKRFSAALLPGRSMFTG